MNNTFLQLTLQEDASLSNHLEEYTISISPSLLHHWEIDPTKPVCLSIGQTVVPVTVQTTSTENKWMLMSSNLINRIKQLSTLCSNFLAQFIPKTQTICLGPIIAILTEIQEAKEGKAPFRSLSTLYKELAHEIAAIGGIVYVCGLQGFSTNCVSGYIVIDNKWVQMELPFPTVVYNRLHSRKLDSSLFFQQVCTKLEEKNIPIFNAQFFSKYDTHLLLKKDTHIQKHLPETHPLTKQILESMLEKYPSLYIKPIHGSQGRNIIHLTLSEGKYAASISTGKQKDKKRFFSHIDQLWKWMQPFSKKRNYLCQQGIDFVKMKECPLDFRVLCHKNYYGEWRATSLVARVASHDAFVANLAQGAEIFQAKSVLKELFGKENAHQIIAQLKELAIETAAAIAAHSNGHFGEMGIDMGVEANLDLWIIEANSKPSKNIEQNSSQIRPSTKALLEYFIRLSFPPE
ncbi:YheC/YheD family endospore coat-associated protein [Niallia nealsonii]|uniref:ATP-grasp domain-containing protein n=1 Tax=Niallia nealsonii TaxID=115979 RepID=A0A2N0Z7E6_9BACI|nr:YheC/YheD family protein [Niallia nealsonii]PKG25430.1 hypothetical protein CWS01_00885 [Niallia nealsonii]